MVIHNMDHSEYQSDHRVTQQEKPLLPINT